jgi:hypothetical protein
MLLEDLLLVMAVGIAVLLLGWPILRLMKAASLRRKDPLAEAHERLRIAKLEAEAARVNRETEKIYETLYAETLAEGHGGGARVATSEESAGSPESEERRPFEKGKRHGEG